MSQKHHQQINNFYFIYKSPGVMLVPAEHTRNDVQRHLNYEKPLKNRRFSYQSVTVGLPIVNQSYYADGRALHYGARHVAVLSRLYLEGFWELEGAVEYEQCCPCILQAYLSAWNGFQYAPRFRAPRKCWKLSFFKEIKRIWNALLNFII